MASKPPLPKKVKSKPVRDTWQDRHHWWKHLGNGAFMKPKFFHP